MATPDYEISILKEGRYQRIVGIDEVGRGCWAGPVAVGAYHFVLGSEVVEGTNDSKQLKVDQRESLFAQLSSHPHQVVMADSAEIDKEGVTKAVAKLIANLVTELDDGNTLFLIDGHFIQNFGENSRQIIGGDALHYSIAAASILAKVTRDALMVRLASQYPGYHFEQHKGYGTKLHRQMLASRGISPIHRRSYKPVQLLMSPV